MRLRALFASMLLPLAGCAAASLPAAQPGEGTWEPTGGRSPEKATTVLPGESLAGVLGRGEARYFRVRLAEGEALRATAFVQNIEAASAARASVAVLGLDGAPLAEASVEAAAGSRDFGHADVTAPPGAGGALVLRVRSEQGTGLRFRLVLR